jgi:hypothetical protein
MPWEQVFSSAFRRIRYNEAERTLDVEFHTGLIWRYTMVPPDVFEQGRQMRSWGKWYNQFIKGFYPEFPDITGSMGREA